MLIVVLPTFSPSLRQSMCWGLSIGIQMDIRVPKLYQFRPNVSRGYCLDKASSVRKSYLPPTFGCMQGILAVDPAIGVSLGTGRVVAWDYTIGNDMTIARSFLAMICSEGFRHAPSP